MKDLTGRAYATVADTKAGSFVETDGGFICMDAGERKEVFENNGLYIRCYEGIHHLSGQEDDTHTYYIGLYPAD